MKTDTRTRIYASVHPFDGQVRIDPDGRWYIYVGRKGRWYHVVNHRRRADWEMAGYE